MATIKRLLKDEVSRRYFVPASSGPYRPNKIADELCLKAAMSLGNVEIKDKYVISEWFANSYGIRQLPFKMMLQTLNITDAHLKDLVLKVKRKNLDFHFIGLGGTGMNTVYWLQKILDHTGDVYLFNLVNVYDDDLVEYSNLFRFPQDLSTKTNRKKAYLYDNRNSLGRQYNIFMKKFVFEAGNTYFSNDIFYGAPDLATRQAAAASNANFIAATHGGNSCSMTVKPEIDENIQTEGYGVIHLNTFFWNQLAMTIGLLEFLAEDTMSTVKIDSDTPSEPGDEVFQQVSKWDREGQIFRFSFEEFIYESKQGRANRKIDFNLSKDEGGRG